MHERERQLKQSTRATGKSPDEKEGGRDDEIILLEDLTPNTDVMGGGRIFGEQDGGNSDRR